MTWSEQQAIESHAPVYLRNVIRILIETGLRVYKELAPLVKEQVDLRTSWYSEQIPKVFKKYSQMKLQMKREALTKLNRHASEKVLGFDTLSRDRMGFDTVLIRFGE
jgi:hypothetical protein